jgi:hypothetical protein
MIIPIYIRIKGIDVTGVSIRALREITRESHRIMAVVWHRQFVALHFEPPAKFRYGYKPRTEKYRKRKLRKGKGNTDLIYSGLTQETMLRPPLIRAFPNRARLSMAGPSYVGMKPYKGGNRPNLGAEITTITPDEVSVLEQNAGREMTAGIKRALDSCKNVTINIGSHT